MLCLSRLPKQRIILGENVVITIVRVVGRKVTLGFEAPDDVAILRSELVVELPPEKEESHV